MKNFLLVVVGALVLLVGGIALWTWLTIPPAVDPDQIPSHPLDLPSTPYADAIEEGRSIARTLVAEEKLPGLSLAVAIEGGIVWAEGFRWADLEREIPVTPTTLFRIGGISMALTSAAVGLLSQRGQLDLDAPIRQYLLEFPEKEWPFTTRQLMSNTAGVHPYRGEGGIFRGPNCVDDAERLAAIGDEPLQYRPGTERRFSTFGWSMVGAIVAAVADQPFLGFMEEEVFTRLGMDRTIPDLAQQTEAGAARFYYPRLMLDPRYGVHDAPDVDLSCHLPAVGFLSTPSDLVRFGSAMMEGRLLDPETIADLQEPQWLASGEPTSQALGWTVLRIPLGSEGTLTRVVGQGLGETVVRGPLSAENVGGQVAGGTAMLLIVPGHRVAIAVVTNVSGSANASRLGLRLADIFVRSLQSR